MGKSDRWRGTQPNEYDIYQALAAFTQDIGLSARLVIKPGSEANTLYVTAQSFRVTEGVSIGIHQYTALWTPSSRSYHGEVLVAMHHCYQASYEKAFTEPYPHRKRTR